MLTDPKVECPAQHEILPDDKWSRDVRAEYRLRKNELKNCSKSRIQELKEAYTPL